MAVVIFGILFICVVFLLFKTYKFYTTVYRIPSPPGLPIIGNLFQFLSKPGRYTGGPQLTPQRKCDSGNSNGDAKNAEKNRLFYKIRKFSDQYYPIYRLSTFYFTIAVLLDPRDIEIILTSAKHISKSRAYHYLKQWLGTGLLTSTGSKWHNRRKILTPAFHFDVLQQFVPIFNEESEKLVQKLKNECDKEVTDVIPIITNFTLQTIGETAMGFKNANEEDYLGYKKAVYRMGNILLQRLAKPWFHLQFLYNLSPLGREEKNVIKIIRDFTDNIIIQRKNADKCEETLKKRLAMLDLLLSIKLDHDGIREEVDTFMFEGHDTTSMAISFILLTLANQKHIQEKIFDEIVTIVGLTEVPTFHDLQNLKYTERCIKECLRLFPSVPFITRRAGEDFSTVNGYLIPKNTVLHIHIFDIHRNPRLYPDPLKFDPDRFLPENVNNRHLFAYIPFSAGPRNCIGQRFAILELKVVLCAIVRNFVLEPVDDMFNIKFKADLVLRPLNGIKIKITPRLI